MLIELFLIGGGLATYLHQRNKPNKTVSPNFSPKKLLQDFKTSILGDERQQQQLTLAPEMLADIEKYEKEANRNLVLSAGAMHDLEIRGAGELLGGEQSGHIQEIGYGLYTELLEQAVNSLKSGEPIELNQPLKNSTEVNLHSTALLPSDYINDVHTRLILYKWIANAPTIQALDDIEIELIDRFSLLPAPAKALMKTTEIKLTAIPLGIRKIDFGPKGGYLLFNKQPNIRAEQLIALLQEQPTDYRLEGQEKLHFLMELEEFSERCKILESLLARLST